MVLPDHLVVVQNDSGSWSLGTMAKEKPLTVSTRSFNSRAQCMFAALALNRRLGSNLPIHDMSGRPT